MKEFMLEFVVPIILIFVVLIGLTVGLVVLAEGGQCSQLTQLDPNHNYHFGFWTGCVVQVENGRWVDADNYYQIEDTVKEK